MGNSNQTQVKSAAKPPDPYNSLMGSTMSIPLLRSFFGEAPPTPKQNHVDFSSKAR